MGSVPAASPNALHCPSRTHRCPPLLGARLAVEHAQQRLDQRAHLHGCMAMERLFCATSRWKEMRGSGVVAERAAHAASLALPPALSRQHNDTPQNRPRLTLGDLCPSASTFQCPIMRSAHAAYSYITWERQAAGAGTLLRMPTLPG